MVLERLGSDAIVSGRRLGPLGGNRSLLGQGPADDLFQFARRQPAQLVDLTGDEHPRSRTAADRQPRPVGRESAVERPAARGRRKSQQDVERL